MSSSLACFDLSRLALGLACKVRTQLLGHQCWTDQIVPDEQNAPGSSRGISVPKCKTIIEYWLQLAFNTSNEPL